MRWNNLIIEAILLTLLFNACTSIGPVQEAILAKSDSCIATKGACAFPLSDFTNFEWDRMYLFDEDTRLEKISSILKIQYQTDISEDNVRMIFTLKGKIVHQEDYDWGSSAKRVINNFALPFDTTSILTTEGCFTKLMPFVSKQDALYLLSRTEPETSPLFSKLERKNQQRINLILVKNLGKCYEGQSTVEDIQ